MLESKRHRRLTLDVLTRNGYKSEKGITTTIILLLLNITRVELTYFVVFNIMQNR